MSDTFHIIHIRQASIIERFNAVLYPVDIGSLLERLPELGWLVPTRMLDDSQSIEAPSKGNTRLRIDTGNKTLGVTGNNIEEALNTYRELRQAYKTFIDSAPAWSTDYVELRYIGALKGRASPVKAFADWWKQSEEAMGMSALVKSYLPPGFRSLGPYGIRIAPQGVDANRIEWAELSLIPSNVLGNTVYHFDLIFRNPDSSVTEQVAESANTMLEALLNKLER